MNFREVVAGSLITYNYEKRKYVPSRYAEELLNKYPDDVFVMIVHGAYQGEVLNQFRQWKDNNVLTVVYMSEAAVNLNYHNTNGRNSVIVWERNQSIPKNIHLVPDVPVKAETPAETISSPSPTVESTASPADTTKEVLTEAALENLLVQMMNDHRPVALRPMRVILDEGVV